MRQRFEAPYWVVHRADLQTILLDAVRSEPSIRLVMGRTVEAVEDGPDGSRPHLDHRPAARARPSRPTLIIGADGIWSKVRQALGDGSASDLSRLHRLARDLRPECRSGGTGRRRDRPVARSARPCGALSHRRRAAHQRGGHREKPDARRGLGRAGPARRPARPLRLRRPCPAPLLAQPQEWLRWSLFDHPAERLAKGRIALLGDAAHPVLPFLAQGAALAIEDAATLACLLRAEAAGRPASPSGL